MNFIQQAYKGLNDFWRYLLVIILVFVGWQIIGAIPLIAVALSHVKNNSEFIKAAETMFMNIGINSNLFLTVMILMFAFGLIALIYGVKWLHQRKFKTVVTSRKKIDWKRVFFAFILWFGISIIQLVIMYFAEPEIYTWNFKPIPFFTLVAIAFLLLPLQTSFEELLFRGYFMQGIGVLVKNKWIPLIITSVAFGLLHAFNPEVDILGPMIMIYYIGTGLFLGLITLFDEGTELALGFHAANNIVAAVFITTTWTVFQTEALLIDTSVPTKVGLETFIPIFVLYPLLLIVFAKKYHWTNLKDKIFGKIEKPKTKTDFFKEESFLEV
jgi:membrane protease YdiL (CAAX protease family)